MRSACLAVLTAVTLLPAVAWPCSLVQRPNAVQPIGGGVPIPVRLDDGGTDAAPPARPVLSNLKVNLVKNPCDGSGAACPQLDSLEFTVASGDTETPTDRLRYVAAFGATASEAATAEATLLFEADFSSPTAVSAWLGLNGLRSGTGFDRASYCFTLSAVDDGANVSPRSDALCVDTITPTAPTTTVTQGTACGGVGCGCTTPSGLPVAWVALFALAWLGFSRARALARDRSRSRGPTSGR